MYNSNNASSTVNHNTNSTTTNSELLYVDNEGNIKEDIKRCATKRSEMIDNNIKRGSSGSRRINRPASLSIHIPQPSSTITSASVGRLPPRYQNVSDTCLQRLQLYQFLPCILIEKDCRL